MIVISDDEHQQALQYAAVSINHTYDRMDYGDLPDADAIRFRHVYVGKAVEYAALRFLRAEYGLNLDPEPVETHYTEPDRADWVLTTRDVTRLTADMKSFHIFRRYQNDVRTCESIERRTWALVPQGQLNLHPKNLYIFATLLGDTTVTDNLTGPPRLDAGAGICDIRWEELANVQQWERKPRGGPDSILMQLRGLTT